MSKKKLLLCGATGFIGRNILESLIRSDAYEITAVHHKKNPPDTLAKEKKIKWVQADLTQAGDVARVIPGQEILVQAAATTSGARDIVTKPFYHVTDNAVMNSLLFRSAYENKLKHVVFFSCTTMYMPQDSPVKEEDFKGEMIDKYFGVGWTKVYIEKMCEFYARLGPAKYIAIRHSNIYGPHDKYDLERSHVFGATVAKVMAAKDRVEVWGDGSDERDLLHVDDLVDFVELALEKQDKPFELLNLGSGVSVSVKQLVEAIIRASGKKLDVHYDLSKPSIGFKLKINLDRTRKNFGWKARLGLDEGIRKTLEWYRANYKPEPAV
ncbi:MAG TPA: NAD-dependent epimerase/dehydratase family protein [Verrucomicrobiae bacterium]|nr:NAD-dependent epimerase/dehydratase family protein [Verrucomicrobiae bacterium]